MMDGGELIAVPAVHHSAVFAEHVNCLCADYRTRPRAIAVELGPSMAEAAALWLKELGVGPSQRKALPLMLGLVAVNRKLRPEVREMATRLQEISGLHLHEIDPTLLRRYLGYCALSLFCLSPTDSIVEAIRCASELEVPLYGVDMDEFPAIDRSSLLLLDPLQAAHHLSRYVGSTARVAALSRDELVDGQREKKMVASLAALVKEHGRVLFTGGIAHWPSLLKLLREGIGENEPGEPVYGEVEILRVIVHPKLALGAVDLFPAVTAKYEQVRQPVNVRLSRMPEPIEPEDSLKNLLRRTYDTFFSVDSTDYQTVEDFEQLIANMCVVQQRLVPDLWTLLEVAEASMSRTFYETLATELMAECPWAVPADHSGLPIIAPDSPLEGEVQIPDGRVELIIESEVAGYRRLRPFFLVGFGSGRNWNIPWRWPGEPHYSAPPAMGYPPRVWPPCDLLLNYICLQAAQAGASPQRDVRSEIFEGSVFDGLDIKATIRAGIRGEERVYVRDRRDSTRWASPHEFGSEPTVLIFTRPREHLEGEWELHGGSLTQIIRPHFKEDPSKRERLDSVIQARGDQFVEGVNFGVYQKFPPHFRPYVVRLKQLLGIMVFTYWHLNAIQEAEWLHRTNYARCPIFPGGDLEELRVVYRGRHNMDLNLSDWPTTLLRLALPYAAKRVYVVAPDHFPIPSSVLVEARAFRVDLCFVPLSFFSADLIQKVRQQWLVRSEDPFGLKYPEILERLMGEKTTANSEFLPPSLLKYGVESEDQS